MINGIIKVYNILRTIYESFKFYKTRMKIVSPLIPFPKSNHSASSKET